MKALYLIKIPAASTAGGKARYEVVLREKVHKCSRQYLQTSSTADHVTRTARQ